MERPRAGRWLAARARAVGRPLGIAIASGLLDGVLVIAQAGLIAWIVHRAVVDGSAVMELWPAFAALAVVFLARAGCTYGFGAAGSAAAGAVVSGVRGELYRHITAVGPARLAQRHSGAVASTLVEQAEALEGYYARFLPQMVLAVAVPLLLIAVAAWLDWLAGLLLLLAVPLVPLFMALVGMGAERLARRQQRTLARISAHYLDRLRGLLTLRLLRAAERSAELVEAAADRYRQRTLSVLRVAFLSSTVLELISAIAIAIVAVYIGFSLLGFLDFGPGQDLTLFAGLYILLLAPEVFLPLRRLALHYHDRANALGAAEEILDLLALPAPTLAPAPPRTPADAADGLPSPRPVALSYEDVHFAFADGMRPVLRGATLRLRPGERVALLGPSGSGKSTLLHLAAGFLQPDSGRVLLDAAPPAGEGAAAWVGQRPWLFHGSLADNLRLADPDAGDARLRSALAAADLGPLLAALPAGLATPLGERGYGLSGGQARRLALARALLAGAPLLLLDEPTEGLDRAAAARLLQTLTGLTGRSILIATHDPAIQAWADRVVRLVDGRLEEDAR